MRCGGSEKSRLNALSEGRRALVEELPVNPAGQGGRSTAMPVRWRWLLRLETGVSECRWQLYWRLMDWGLLGAQKLG